MSSRLPFAGALLCASLLAGCALPQNRPVAVDRTVVKSTDVVASVKQAELYAQINVSNVTGAMGGGLIWALVDAGVNSSRASDAEGTVRPLRDTLIGFDFDSALKHDLERELATVQWLGIRGVEINKTVTDEAADGFFTKSEAGAVLFVTPDYSMSPDFSTLHVSAVVSLFARSPEAAAAAAKAGISKQTHAKGVKTRLQFATYYNTLANEARVHGGPGTLEANRDVWAANQGELIRRELTKGVQQLAKLIAMDLDHAPAKSAMTARPKGEEEFVQGHFRGRILQKGDEGTLVRGNDGTLKHFVSIPYAAPSQQAAGGTSP